MNLLSWILTGIDRLQQRRQRRAPEQFLVDHRQQHGYQLVVPYQDDKKKTHNLMKIWCVAVQDTYLDKQSGLLVQSPFRVWGKYHTLSRAVDAYRDLNRLRHPSRPGHFQKWVIARVCYTSDGYYLTDTMFPRKIQNLYPSSSSVLQRAKTSTANFSS